MRLAILTLAAALFAASAHADVVTDWNVASFDVMTTANVAGAPAARALAIVHVAMADAVNAVQNRHARYAHKGPLQPSASAEVAASSAARSALSALFPPQRARIDAAYAAATSGVPDGPAKEAGVKLGEEAAAAVLADRANDDSAVPDTYRPITTPGNWVPTTPPLTAQYARAKPWGFDNADRFRPGPPPELTSARYARDYNETKDLGGVRSTQRTPAQTEAVKFWSQPNLTLAWYQAARQLGAARQMNLADSARTFALLSAGLANTFIVDWDAKFHYHFWRPITAIRNGDQDNNAATERDAGWVPLNTTPMHPEYPSQASIIAGTASALLAQAVGDANAGPITLADSAEPKLTRQAANLAAMAEEHRQVRIWGGIHFRSSLEASERMGRALAEHMLQTLYTPAR
ncbi:MAG TPA: vanadium-dependent haloperoxidase [Albitalea sp.]|uniref:vanadium-dependent haloperoxidase n=1 Tax=Piscinibacter sp. TaxID=1903157 RepID=UPI002ED0683F